MGPEPAQDAVSGSVWSVPWADLMMVMFVLFVVLFVYASQKRDTALLFPRGDQPAASAQTSPLQLLLQRITDREPPRIESSRQIYEQAHKLLYSSNQGGVSVTMEPDGAVRVNLGGALAFDHNSAVIRPQGMAYLDETAKLLSGSPRRVHIIGYADPSEGDGDPAAQLTLSLSRAAGAATRLMQRYGVEPERFAVSGRGAAGLLAPPTNDANRQKNRRLEIVLLPDPAPDQTGGPK
jgi:chemotaxis protein MotB